MKVDLNKTFEIAAPAAIAWQFLQDIPRVASCMPGAEIVETIDESHYKGKVKAKIGPVTMAFNGAVEVKSINADKCEMHMIGSGLDTKGTSAAEMDLTANIVEVSNGTCQLVGNATVTVNGKAASLGGRMLSQVADQILNQFGKDFTNNVLAMGEGDQAEEAQQAIDQQPMEMNGLALAWSVFIGLIKSIFSSKKVKTD
jgi:carbon monoxide dehydrogenase subunit G